MAVHSPHHWLVSPNPTAAPTAMPTLDPTATPTLVPTLRKCTEGAPDATETVREYIAGPPCRHFMHACMMQELEAKMGQKGVNCPDAATQVHGFGGFFSAHIAGAWVLKHMCLSMHVCRGLASTL